MTPSILVLVSAVIVGLLGAVHLLLTYLGPKLLPRDAAVIDSMKSEHLRITSQTTVWRAWIGFNASHSLGALLFGLVDSLSCRSVRDRMGHHQAVGARCGSGRAAGR